MSRFARARRAGSLGSKGLDAPLSVGGRARMWSLLFFFSHMLTEKSIKQLRVNDMLDYQYRHLLGPDYSRPPSFGWMEGSREQKLSIVYMCAALANQKLDKMPACFDLGRAQIPAHIKLCSCVLTCRLASSPFPLPPLHAAFCLALLGLFAIDGVIQPVVGPFLLGADCLRRRRRPMMPWTGAQPKTCPCPSMVSGTN